MLSAAAVRHAAQPLPSWKPPSWSAIGEGEPGPEGQPISMRPVAPGGAKVAICWPACTVSPALTVGMTSRPDHRSPTAPRMGSLWSPRPMWSLSASWRTLGRQVLGVVAGGQGEDLLDVGAGVVVVEDRALASHRARWRVSNVRVFVSIVSAPRRCGVSEFVIERLHFSTQR